MTGYITVVGIVLGALLTAAGAIGVWAAFRVGKNAQTISNYRDALQSWKERSEAQDVKIAEQDQEMHDLRDHQHKLESENADLRGQISVLRDAISGRKGFDEIVSMLEQHQNQKLGALGQISDKLDELATQVKQLPGGTT